MKIRKQTSFRAAAAIFLAVLTCTILWVAVPVLAADIATPAGAPIAAPIAENQAYSTFRNIPVKGNLAANDPDGDALTFELADLPKKGAVLTEPDGNFVYTPAENMKGRDSFTYVAVDSAGNLSERAVVSVSINKQSTKISYSDMSGNGSYYAALVLAEKGILTGEKLGNDYFFRPNATVTRGEFLTMCLAMNNTKTLQGITRTGFSDDGTIPTWVKPYVTTAMMAGIISGFKNDEGQLVFASQAPVTCSEAAVILNNMLRISDVEAAAALSQDTCPAWAWQAEVNLTACKIISPTEAAAISNNLTRAEAADMLVAAMTVADTRNSDHSLLSWLK